MNKLGPEISTPIIAFYRHLYPFEVIIDEETRRKAYEVGQKGGGGVNTAKKEWGVGELEFEALMRMLDNSGYRTGFQYAEPLVRKEPARMISDVELPPTASNLGYLMDEEELYMDGPLRVSYFENL